MISPQNDPGTNKRARTARIEEPVMSDQQIRALYQETTGNSVAASQAEPAGMKHLLSGWVNAPLGDSAREKMRTAVMNALPANSPPAAENAQSAPVAADLIPMHGTVWIRRAGSRSAIPCSSVQQLSARTAVEVPAGCRAQIHYGDGSLLLLNAESLLEVFPANAERNGDAADYSNAHLTHGRMFAWIAKQSSGRFAIRTPQGRISVVGTEFDVESRGDQSLQVIVAEGQVRYRSNNSSTADSIGDVSLTAGEMLSVPARVPGSPSKPASRRLTTRELRHHISWSRGGRRLGVPLHRGAVLLKAVVVLAVIGAAVAFFLQHDRNSPISSAATRTAETTGSDVSAVQPANANKAGANAAMQPGPEIIADAQIEAKHGNDWVPTQKIQAGTRILELRPDGTRVIETKLRKQETTGQNPMGDISRFIDKTVRYTMLPDGQITDIRLPDVGGQQQPGTGIMFLEMIRHTWMLQMPTSGTQDALLPGQQWELKATGNLSQFPGSTYNFVSSVRYEGQQTDPQGRSVGKFTYKGSGSVGGFPLREENRNGRGVKLTLAEFRSDEAGNFLRPAGTGQMNGEIQEHRTVTVAQTSTAPNQQPFTRNLPPNVEDRRATITTRAAK